MKFYAPGLNPYFSDLAEPRDVSSRLLRKLPQSPKLGGIIHIYTPVRPSVPILKRVADPANIQLFWLLHEL